MLCPMPGKCIHDDFIKTGIHFCSTPVCPYAKYVRMVLSEQIQILDHKTNKTSADLRELEKLRTQYAENRESG